MTSAVKKLIKEANELEVGAELVSALEALGKDAKGSRSEFKELKEIVEDAKSVQYDEVVEDEIIDEEVIKEDNIIEDESLIKYKNNRANAFAIASYTFRGEEFSIDVSTLNETDKKRLARAEELKIITKV
jgi:hypothetical protein